jgi:septal ring factor EnvC (AmiA/AmiB activator)
MSLFDFLWKYIERFDGQPAVMSRLDTIIANQQQTNEKLGAIMANLQQFQTALDRIDTATTNAATVLKEVRDKVAQLEAQQGITATDEASVLQRLDSVGSALEQMGKSPENPVPVDPGTPTDPANPNPNPTDPTNPTPNPPADPPV